MDSDSQRDAAVGIGVERRSEANQKSVVRYKSLEPQQFAAVLFVRGTCIVRLWDDVCSREGRVKFVRGTGFVRQRDDTHFVCGTSDRVEMAARSGRYLSCSYRSPVRQRDDTTRELRGWASPLP